MAPIPGADTITFSGWPTGATVTLDLEPIPPYSASIDRVGTVDRTCNGTNIAQMMGVNRRWNCQLTYVTDATLTQLASLFAVGNMVQYSANSAIFICESFSPQRAVGRSYWTVSISLLRMA